MHAAFSSFKGCFALWDRLYMSNQGCASFITHHPEYVVSITANILFALNLFGTFLC